MADDGRNNRSSLDHVGDGAGKEPYNFAGQTNLFFDEGIGSILFKPLLRLSAAQPVVRLNSKLGKHPINRHLLEVDVHIRLGRGGLQGRSGHGLLSFERETSQFMPRESAKFPLHPGLEDEVSGRDLTIVVMEITLKRSINSYRCIVCWAVFDRLTI